MTKIDLSRLEGELGLDFKNKGLLELALMHRSFAHENKDAPTNERLEFLGDSVLGLVIAEHTFEKYPAMPEGDLAKLRASLVNTGSLAKLAKKIELGKYLTMGVGARKSGTAERESVLECTFEALIGAIYLDRGYEVARAFIIRHFGRLISRKAKSPGTGDHKSVLQELTLEKLGLTPKYAVLAETGPMHDKTFKISVSVQGEQLAVGSGKSKKAAEQRAAELALKKLSRSSKLDRRTDKRQ